MGVYYHFDDVDGFAMGAVGRPGERTFYFQLRADGQRITLASRVGRVQVPVQITDDIRPGVVSLPHGWGHDRAGVQMQVAQAHAGVSINDLTDDRLTDRISANAAFSAVPVWIEAA